MRAWQMQQLGDPWQHMTQVEHEGPEPNENRVVIKVEAADLNFADILQCQGKYQVKLDPPFTPGMGAAGTVIKSTGDIPVGARIVGPTVGHWGAFAEEAAVLTEQATLIDDHVSSTTAAAMHVAYGTAWFGLHLRGHLQPGETVLVLAAAGGVGSAAVDLAKVHGCWVVAAASGAKRDACLGLGADEFVDCESEDWYDQVMTLTYGRGVDVVYDPVGGKYFDVARRLVAWEGRLLIIGFASGNIPSAALNHTLVKNYDLVGVHMGGYRQKDGAPFKQCYEVLYDLAREDKIHPLIDRVVGGSDLPQALLDLFERRSRGRLLYDPQS
jgi:NADPH2:quinone reductase